jgi:AcrR family transcriptional regulator
MGRLTFPKRSTNRRLDTALAIRSTALDLFSRQGYQFTTLRDIATRVGIQVGSLYNHIESKYELLCEIVHTVIRDLLSEQLQIASEPHAATRLENLVSHLVRFEAHRHWELNVAYCELRNLPARERSQICSMQREHDLLYLTALEDGVRQGSLRTLDAHLTTRAIFGLVASLAPLATGERRWAVGVIEDAAVNLVMGGISNRGSLVGTRAKDPQSLSALVAAPVDTSR